MCTPPLDLVHVVLSALIRSNACNMFARVLLKYLKSCDRIRWARYILHEVHELLCLLVGARHTLAALQFHSLQRRPRLARRCLAFTRAQHPSGTHFEVLQFQPRRSGSRDPHSGQTVRSLDRITCMTLHDETCAYAPSLSFNTCQTC